jgi:hypothetical protein
MGYCVISVIDDYSIRLSGDLSELCAAMTEKRLSDYQDLNSGSKAIGGFVLGGGELSDARFSIALGPQSGSMRLQIQSVDL